MTGYHSVIARRAVRTTVAVLLAAAPFVACTEVDDRLGEGLIPDEERMMMRIDTLYGIDTYNTHSDSLRSTNLPYAYIGQMRSDTFGLRRARLVTQFIPSSIPYESGFGLNPIFDSLQLYLTVDDWRGDTTVSQQFRIYEVVKDFIAEDTTMYINFDPKPYIDPDPLFAFSFNTPSTTGVTLKPTGKGRDFIRRLMEADSATYHNDTLWFKAFKGLYLEPEPVTDGRAALYSASIRTTGLRLYTRDHDSTDINLIKDTTEAIYPFYLTNAILGNVSVALMEYDFEGSRVMQAGVNDTLATSSVQGTLFVEGMGGVNGYIRFNETFVRALGSLQDRAAEEGYRISAINQAMIYFPLEGDALDPATITPLLNAAPDRLGMYYNLRELSAIPDYNYLTEYTIQQQQNSEYILPYDGFLNRSNVYYPMDVTIFLQRMWHDWQEAGGDIDRVPYRSITLAPSAYDMFSFGAVLLQGTAEDAERIPVKITYTLLK